MICYKLTFNVETTGREFQTMLTYGMICYAYIDTDGCYYNSQFQTKLTYGMICYSIKQFKCLRHTSFKLS